MFESCWAHQTNFVGLACPPCFRIKPRVAFGSAGSCANHAGRTNLRSRGSPSRATAWQAKFS
jgi:hypothetical protein